ncbi:MAG TPA: vWA domain-containing protein [Gaiellaceae bacterium]|nr:vWA domain-containing protein [Gaiellaceae bacterium]
MSIWNRSPSVDSHETQVLRRVSLRTRVLQAVLVIAALALFAQATASARALDPAKPTFLPERSGVLVLDLSLSIGEKDYAAIRQTLRRLIDDDGSMGLVIFSDLAYELLPPGTPSAELRPLVRYLVPRRGGADEARPVSPWSESFSAGTRISAALELARNILRRDGVKNGSILLVSDLVTAPEDVPELARTLHELNRQSLIVRVVALSPLQAGRTVFETLLGKDALIEPSQLRNPQRVTVKTQSALPTGFLILGGILLAVLAANERFAGRLGLPSMRRQDA